MIAGIIGFPIAIWRSIVASRQAAATQKQSETAQHSLLNERYQKGAEMLGSDLLSVRMGGIYALQRLADDHPRRLPYPNYATFLRVHEKPACGQKESRHTGREGESV